MQLHFLGGAMEIGGSCIYLRAAGRGILMDSGIRQSSTKDPLPDFRTIQEQGGLDAILVSHAHMDHIGTLPVISRAYPLAPIYMTAMTADLTRVLLYDSLKIMNLREDEIPHYSEQDVLAMLGRIRPVGYQTPFPLFDGFTLTLYPAGHIAGAACIYLATEEGTLFYSGDFSSFSQRTIEGISIPKLRPDIAIVETTYGNRLHANRQTEENRLAGLVGECIRQKKKILIPVFALGRAQEVLLILRAAIQNQEIPPVPVYVDGMVRDINIMYTRNPSYLKNALGKRILKGNEPFYTKEIQPVAASQKRDALLSGEEPAIFLSSSGMLTGGPSTQYALQLAASENACIIITGYQDEESPGRQLLNLLEHPEEGSLTLNGTTIPVKCRVEQVGLSAHGDKSEIIALLDRLSARQIFLVHGNPDAMEELGKELASEDFRRQIFLPECGQSYEISLHSKRKQLSFRPSHTMQMGRDFTAEDGKLLWDYWQEYYTGKYFSISQIAHIWYGRAVSEQETLQSMQELLLKSCYFSPNAKRLFLLEANTPEKIAEALAPKELTQQELTARIESAFAGFSYRKISYHNERREVLLQFDYPDAQNKAEFEAKAEVFAADTGWSAHISPSMNHNAAALLLSVLFGNRLVKTSYYPEKKCYAVALAQTQGCPAVDSHANMRQGCTLSDSSTGTPQCCTAVDSQAGTPQYCTAVDSNAETSQCRTAADSHAETSQCRTPADSHAGTSQECTPAEPHIETMPGFPASPGRPKEGLDTAAAAEQFLAATGWTLTINGQSQNGPVPSASREPDTATDFFVPADTRVETAEQNLAFFCIDQVFESLPHKPDKKSLKQDAMGKYLEISFISPMIGRKFQEQLQDLSSQTGWRIRISEKVNMNELFKTAQLLCMKYGIPLAKNPSYLPEKKALQLKTAGTESSEDRRNAAEEFLELTGCECCWS